MCLPLFLSYMTRMCGRPQRPGEGVEAPGAGVIDGYELSDVDTGM